MKTMNLVLVAVVLLTLLSCKKNKTESLTEDPAPTGCTPQVITVTTDVTTPTVWSACNIYVVSVGQISITSTLTIEPGAVVKFKDNVGDNAIIVSAAGKIMAEGTADKPIVFTSYKDDAHGGDNNGDAGLSSPARLDWGGIIMNSNTCSFKYCLFMYGGEGPSSNVGQPTLEYSYHYGTVDHCTFAYCGGEAGYAGYGVVDARSSENPNFIVTNSTFYGCIKPIFMSPHNSIDNSNTFHNPANPTEKNQLNGIFLTSTSNEPTTNVSWLETEVPFVLTGSTSFSPGLNLIIAQDVIIKVATLPSIGYNKISFRDGKTIIQGYNLPGVFFTSYLDDAHGGDTNGDGTATLAAPGDWYGIQDVSASIGTNNNCYQWSNVLYAKFP